MKSTLESTLRSVFLALALICVFCSYAIAQEVTGTLVGTVKDANGAGVSGATITISDADKKVVTRTLTANEAGEFSAPNLLPGVYDVSAEAPNFKRSVQSKVKLDVGQRRTVDFALEAGQITEAVTVESTPVQVELSTPTASGVINGNQARELSLNNRNWVQLVTLAPGVSNDLADQVYVGTTNPEGQANTINISVNGARSSQNTFTVDGADITDRGSNITIQAYPSVDSIGEFKVLRSLFPAESGRSGGGQVNVVTRSGTSEFHGSAFEFIRNEAFNANNFLLNSTTNPPFGRNADNGKAKRAPFRYNNYGFTIGGPVYVPAFGEGEPGGSIMRKLSKTFFFFSEEARRDRRFTSAATVTVPDAALRQGIFPIDVCINRNNVASENCNVGNPGRLPAGTPIPASMLSPAAVAYVNQIYNKLPVPNAATAAAPYNLTVSIANKADFRQEILKIDQTFNDAWSGYYRYQHDSIPTVDGNSLFSSGSGLPFVSTTETNSPGKTHTLQATWVQSPSSIFEFRYNYGYGAILSSNVGLLSLQQTSIPVSLPFANQRDRVPTLTGNGFTGLTSFGPYDNFSYKHNFNVTYSWIKGSHTTKYGGTYSIYRKNENALAGSNEGNFSVFPSTVASACPAAPAPQPPGCQPNTALNQNRARWANFLVGNVSTFTQAHFDYTADLRQKAVEAFAQDEWRARSNLTVYLGVRYSYFPSPWDKNGRLSNFDPAFFNRADAPTVRGDGTRVAGTGNFCNGLILNSQNFTTGPASFNCRPNVSPWGKYVIDVGKTDFAPRVGLAWDPFHKGKTAVRTGYGIYHEQTLVGTFLQNIGLNPPYQETLTATNTRLDSPAGSLTVSSTPQGLRSLQTDWHTPYMQHWSFDVQHQLTAKTVLTVGYYGSKGTHLIGVTELNDIAPGVARNSTCINAFNQTVTCQPAGYVFRNAGSNTVNVPNNPNANQTNTALQNTDILILDQIRPYRGYRSIAMIQPRFDSNYHSLQVFAEHRFSGASQANFIYTWAKNLTNSPNDRTTSPQDTYDIKSEYQRATLDRRHILSFNYIYELPFYKSQHDFVGKVLGGWQASGIITYNSGLPFTATTSNLDYAGLGLINANPAARPNLLCDPNENAPHTLQWVSISCFQLNPGNTDVTNGPNLPGTAPRGVINGPPTARVDFTMTKNIRFTENVNLQLRGEVFNIFNHTNFRSFVSTNVTSTSFGLIGVVRDPRTMQFGAKLSF